MGAPVSRIGRRRRAESRPQERTLFGTPARFMVPRLVFIGAVAALVGFGLLMIFSSSSITALTTAEGGYDPAHYLQRQAAFVIVGLGLASIAALVDYRSIVGRGLPFLMLGSIFLLLLVFLPSAGQDAYGATRWISVGGFSLQPSEFAKATVVIAGAVLITQYSRDRFADAGRARMVGGLGLVVPFVLILLQPDKGTVMICVATLLAMCLLGGVPAKFIIGLLFAGIAGFLFISLKDDYSRQRIVTLFNPWADRYNTGYQLIQGFYAFGSGGLFGVGIGMSKQKYGFLPMAYNDFIFAVIGEECGLVGTLGMICAFMVLLWAGFRIARYAPDLTGTLVAAGCTTMLIVQMLLNVSGVLGVFPLSGKPIPFISYGGSSVIASLLLAGLVVNVSLRSTLPDTEHDARRRSFALRQGQDDYDCDGATSDERSDGFSHAGRPTPRSARGHSLLQASFEAPRRSFTVLGGGREGHADSVERRERPGRREAYREGMAARGTERANSPEALRREREERARSKGARYTTDRNGRRRIDLGPSAGDRLRKDDSRPEVRGTNYDLGDRRSGRRGR